MSTDLVGADPSDRLATSLVLVFLVLLALPALVFTYLPMTDLPQHLAIASIFRNLEDPSFGFDAYYEAAVGRTLYLFPYALHLLIAEAVSLEIAMRIVVFLTLLPYPVACLVALRALGKPAWLALLSIPLVYHRAFFWGFIHFDLAVGFAFLVVALLLYPRPGRVRQALIFLFSLLASLSHVYGVAVVLGFAGLWVIVARGRVSWRRLLPASPALLGAVAWYAIGRGVPGYGSVEGPSLSFRAREALQSILGGYRDDSETVILIILIGLVSVLSFQRSLSRWRALDPREKALFLAALMNLLLYFVLPEHTRSAKFVHFRHALLAALVMPLLPRKTLWLPRYAFLLAALLAAGSIANAWIHLQRFDRESRSFAQVAERIPPGSRVMQLNWDADGLVMQTRPYAHFAAYVQAKKGGYVSSSFARVFWNVPIRLRQDAPVPPAQPLHAEWHPERYDYASFGSFYDLVLERGTRPPGAPDIPVDPVYEDPPWRLGRTRGR